jgi:hypothetical protein
MPLVGCKRWLVRAPCVGNTVLFLLSLALQVYARAVRNCPWSGAVWEAALRALERSGAPDEQHAALADQALAAGLQVRHKRRGHGLEGHKLCAVVCASNVNSLVVVCARSANSLFGAGCQDSRRVFSRCGLRQRSSTPSCCHADITYSECWAKHGQS